MTRDHQLPPPSAFSRTWRGARRELAELRGPAPTTIAKARMGPSTRTYARMPVRYLGGPILALLVGFWTSDAGSAPKAPKAKAAAGKGSTGKAQKSHTLSQVFKKSPRLALSSRTLLRLQIVRDKRGLSLERQTTRRLRKPRTLRRFRGPFSVELYDAHSRRLDIVHFSFPLSLAAGEPSARNRQLNNKLAKTMTGRTTVLIPFPKEVHHIILVDPFGGKRARYALRSDPKKKH